MLKDAENSPARQQQASLQESGGDDSSPYIYQSDQNSTKRMLHQRKLTIPVEYQNQYELKNEFSQSVSALNHNKLSQDRTLEFIHKKDMSVVQRQGELYKERQLEKYRKQQINSMVRNATIQKVNARN